MAAPGYNVPPPISADNRATRGRSSPLGSRTWAIVQRVSPGSTTYTAAPAGLTGTELAAAAPVEVRVPPPAPAHADRTRTSAAAVARRRRPATSSHRRNNTPRVGRPRPVERSKRRPIGWLAATGLWWVPPSTGPQ